VKDAPQQPVYQHRGWCPICEAAADFVALADWFRDDLICSGCGSIPRERAVALVLFEEFPRWRRMRIHESSPTPRGVSLKMQRECAGYVATQYHPKARPGASVGGYRNENLEAQTFADGAFDLVVSLDVMEHVNRPDVCFREIWRTLAEGGAYLFTAPTEKRLMESRRAARFLDDGTIEHYVEPVYHGNPVDPMGSLVTVNYGYDLPKLIGEWAPFDVRCLRFWSPTQGVIGEYTETYLCRKRDGRGFTPAAAAL